MWLLASTAPDPYLRPSWPPQIRLVLNFFEELKAKVGN